MTKPLTVSIAVYQCSYTGPHSGDGMPAEDYQAILAWVAGLGVDPATVLPQLAVERLTDGTCVLHLSRKVKNADGYGVLDLAAQRVWTEPLKIDLGAGPSLPDALNRAKRI